MLAQKQLSTYGIFHAFLEKSRVKDLVHLTDRMNIEYYIYPFNRESFNRGLKSNCSLKHEFYIQEVCTVPNASPLHLKLLSQTMQRSLSMT